MHITLLMRAFTIFTETKCTSFNPPKFYITIVSNFSWVLQPSKQKLKTMVTQIWWGGGDEVHYGLSENSELCFL